MALWQASVVLLWHCGRPVLYSCGIAMALWQASVVLLWHCGRPVLYCYGIVAGQCCIAMALWQASVVFLWYCYGIVVGQCFCLLVVLLWHCGRPVLYCYSVVVLWWARVLHSCNVIVVLCCVIAFAFLYH